MPTAIATERTRTVQHEQAVYGSFAFWDRGYAVLAQSPGVRAEWLLDLQAACQRYGEPARGVDASGAMFAERLPSGPWAIVGVVPQGSDDHGRPGALAFHAIFVTQREFRKVGYDPFALTGALRQNWGPETTLRPGEWPIDAAPTMGPVDAQVRTIAARLTAGRRVALESSTPLGDLMRAVWGILSPRVRRRASLATLAFSNASGFDLVALPRLAGLTFDVSYDPPGAAESAVPRLARRTYWAAAAAVMAVVGLGVLVAIARWGGNGNGTNTTMSGHAAQDDRTISRPRDEPPPSQAVYPHVAITEDERRQVTEGLMDLAERLGVSEGLGSSNGRDPTLLITHIARKARYGGPLLTERERAQIHRQLEGAGALELDRQIRRFVADRPLPAAFADGPLRWQLDVLFWSFHVPRDRKDSVGELPDALADAILPAVPIRPSPLAVSHPALGDYARFLGRLARH